MPDKSRSLGGYRLCGVLAGTPPSKMTHWVDIVQQRTACGRDITNWFAVDAGEPECSVCRNYGAEGKIGMASTKNQTTGESPFVVVAIDTHDRTLESMANLLRATLDQIHSRTPLESVQVLRVDANYTTYGEAGDHREYHYRDTGFILVGKKVGK